LSETTRGCGQVAAHDHRLVDLPEISLVNFPANPDAQVQVVQRMSKRAGRVLSADNARRLLEAHDHLTGVLSDAGVLPVDEDDGLDAMPTGRAHERDEAIAVEERYVTAYRREQMARRLLWLEQQWPTHPAVMREIADLHAAQALKTTAR
jgi:hypothetical protein